MSLISSLTAIPNRLAAIYETIAYAGENGIESERLLRLHAPLPPKAVSNDEEKGTLANESLKELKALQIVVEVENKLRLSSVPSLQEFRLFGSEYYSRRSIEAVLYNPTQAKESGQQGVCLAIAWLLIQDPLKPLPKRSIPLERIKEGLDLEFGGNDARYQNFLYWARYLGFAQWIGSAVGDAVIADPSGAIERRLESIFAGQKTLTVQAFIARLAKSCPLFEGGLYREQIEAASEAQYSRQEGWLSRSTSLALIRLERRGKLRLSAPSDAQALVLDNGNQGQQCSIIERTF